MRFVFIFIALLFSFDANSSVRCTKDSLGYTKCSGHDKNGNRVNTRSKETSLGTIRTTGSIGDEKVRATTKTDFLGNKKTTGKVGDKKIRLKSKEDFLGNEKVSGRIGDDRINQKIRKEDSSLFKRWFLKD